MNDRLDDTLREIAGGEAPEGFAARVRARIEGDHVASGVRFRLAAAVVVLLLGVAGWLAVKPSGDPRSVRLEAGRSDARPETAEVRREPGTSEVRLKPDTTDLVTVGPPRVRTSHAALTTGVSRPPDHERALPALAEYAPVGPAPLATVEMTFDARDVVPLASIAPIEIAALAADEGERR